jgi:hypothetical protein
MKSRFFGFCRLSLRRCAEGGQRVKRPARSLKPSDATRFDGEEIHFKVAISSNMRMKHFASVWPGFFLIVAGLRP